MIGVETHAARIRFAQQRVQHVARSVGIGEELAARLFVQPDTKLLEERDRVSDGESAQDAANDRSRAAPEVGFVDRDVGDVATRAATDQDLRARLLRAVEE